MTACACSMSSLHAHSALPCCPSSQVRSVGGVGLPERPVGVPDSVVVTWRSANQFSNVDSKAYFIKTFSLGHVEASSRLRKIHARQSGVSVGLKDYSKAGPTRKPVSEVQYRVQDDVESGELTENGTDDPRRRNKDRNRKQRRSGERRRRVQILGNNGVVDLEEHLGLTSDDEILSREEFRGGDSTGMAVRRTVASSDEEGRRLLESSLLQDDIAEIQGRRDSVPSLRGDASVSSQTGRVPGSERSELYSGDREVVRSANFSEDVIEVELAEQGSRASFGSDVHRQNDWGKSAVQGRRSLAELPGGRRVVELVAAWDGLAGRLPPEFSRSSVSNLLLRALKLTVMALQHTAPDDAGRTPLCRALAVAHTLVDLGMDAEVISTGLLREVVDVGLVSYAVIEENLGGNIAHLLRDCSRVRHIPSRVETLDDDSATALRQFCLAFHDIRAVVVELASQLDIMQHIHSIPKYRQQILALETMQVYAPLAHAIGTGSMALELEDLGFRVLFPDSYSYIETWLRSHWIDGSEVVDEFKEQLSAKLKEDSEMQTLVTTVNVLGRYKSRFSTMRKLLKDGRTPDEVYDVLGLRVILEPKGGEYDSTQQRERGIRACYRALEIATGMWQEVPGRLKDYIANSKENGYESLHLAVYVSDQNDGRPPMEIQIRTTEMDAAAVSGEASHSLYKGGVTDPEQIRNLKLMMVAAADAAASRFGEIAGNAVDLEGGDHVDDDRDQMFKMFDKNQDGVISVEEIREVITELGAEEGDALELMQIVDLNTDGSVSAEEFGKFRHQIQIYQSLAGVDRDCSSRLGSKLQGSSEGLLGRRSLSSGKSPKYVAGLIPQRVENKFVSTTCTGMPSASGQPSELSPLDSIPEAAHDQYSITTLRTDDVGTSDKDNSSPLHEETKGKSTTSPEDSTLSNGSGSGSKIPSLSGKPKPNSVKPSGATGNLSRASLQDKQLGLAEEVSKWPDSVKAAVLDEVDVAREVDNVSTESVVDHKLSNIRQQAVGNLVAARDLAAQVSKEYPHSTKALLHHASLERKCGNLKAASALYSQAIDVLEFKADLGVEYVRALQAWASLEVQAGNVDRARHLFTDSIGASEKGDVESSLRGAGVYGLHGWAMLEEKSGNWTKARDLLERAANLQPGNAVVHQSRASLEARAHNYSAARIHFTRAVKAAPEDVRCWHAWAKFEASRGNVHKMRQLFKRALEVDPKNLHSLQAWAHHEGQIGTAESRSQARKLYQNCVDVNPENTYCWQSWGILEQESENYEGARVLFKRGLEADEESVACLQAYAHMERKCGNLEAAQILLRRALAVDQNNAAVLMELALIEDTSGNDSAALDLYKRAARVDKQKSYVKRRMFETRKRDLQASGSLPKSKGARRPWRKTSPNRDFTDGSSRITGYDSSKLETQYERIFAVATTGPSDR